MAREKAKLIRLGHDELRRWEEGARRLGTSVSALVRASAAYYGDALRKLP